MAESLQAIEPMTGKRLTKKLKEKEPHVTPIAAGVDKPTATPGLQQKMIDSRTKRSDRIRSLACLLPSRWLLTVAIIGAIALGLEKIGAWRVLWENWYYLGMGFMTSWFLSIAAISIGMVIGTVLAVARLYAPIGLRHISIAFIEIVRAIPDLMVIFWIYYGVPSLTGIHVDEMPAAIASLSVIASAYLAEDVRAGLSSIPRIQSESAYATGLKKHQIFLFITLPQALRNMIPAIIATVVRIFKVTSVVFIVGVVDFFRAAIIINNIENTPYAIYAIVAAVYFVCCYTVSQVASRFGTTHKFAH